MTFLGFHLLHHVVLVRRIRVDDGERAVGIRRKRVTAFRVVIDTIHARGDRQPRDHLPSLVVRHSHHPVPATAEDAVVRSRSPSTRVAGKEPSASAASPWRSSVDFDHFTRVREIRVNLAVAGGRAVLGLPAEGDVRHALPCAGRTVEECASPLKVNTQFEALS